MRRKLQGFGKLLLVLSVLFSFGACTEKKYYEDSSVLWEVMNYTIDSEPGADGIWRWDETKRRFFCDIYEPKLSQFIYNSGTVVSYVFFGDQGLDESQVLLPLHELLPDGTGVNISCDYSYDKGRRIRFYFHWDDDENYDPGLCNFRVVFMY